LLVRSWTNADAKTFTFRLKRNARFADGMPLTSADVVFSLRRLVNLQGNPSFLLAGMKVSAAGKYTVVMRSQTPVAQLPSVLANPSTGIVNPKLVRAHRGTDAVDAPTTDKADRWFNSPASGGAGSGPYELESYSVTSQITLRANPNYWGVTKPAFRNVVLRNMPATTQLLNIQRGSHEIAVDLSSDQAQTLVRLKSLHVSRQTSPWVFYLFTNSDPQVSAVTSNRRFQQAVRSALDYRGIASVAGRGAIQAPGIVGLWLWAPDYADPADYLVFTPGKLIALHVGWPTGSDPTIERLAQRAAVATAPSVRKALYRRIQRELNARGPFVPLIQPTQVFVTTRDTAGAVFSGAYDVDVTQVFPK
jgi:peptide/nickel transport system substrate-binding protein